VVKIRAISAVALNNAFFMSFSFLVFVPSAAGQASQPLSDTVSRAPAS
jgi:hypothetical protein